MKLNNFLRICCILLAAQSAASYGEDLEIDGLVLDRSISRFGHQFYFEFANLWRDLPSTAGFNIEIKETVLPRAGTRLVLRMNNQIVYVTYLGRRLEPLDERVKQAMYSVMDAMARNKMQQSSPDMAKNGW
ncbi:MULTISPECIES: curli production assembly/transport protein CsgE [Pseudoalteromonas]|uniref:Curli production assembly/transport component CsgE n=1 Tax=Pseudoalteromonas lipolytica TaxID=570156 RepID=A0A0P7E5K2_9GAMM|nr:MULTISPECIES: curli production assembly/transport protein CsgE [Pseudoalteromonas]KPM82487.1 curli production assembly protein CsgE [Pseudoalteromonas lipolytica]MCF2918083.1 curli production assembly/transport protein CsgE [Pseudoalteromonas sp. Cn5-37]MCH2087676.1 curli production assembly/transport protein CsgE [Pseudoalteromonas sp.]|tara:strand:- start:1624 stop:2016 length:393 start_codon:yes stop_codon:yes gene_type:complete